MYKYIYICRFGIHPIILSFSERMQAGSLDNSGVTR